MAEDVVRDVPVRYPAGTAVRFGEIVNQVSWGAIWAGVMVTLGMEALFLSFGVFIGSMFTGSGIFPWTTAWYLVTMGFSFFVGAWTAARMSNVTITEHGILHGLSAWGLATLATVVIVGIVLGAVLREGTILLVNNGTAPASVTVNALL
jgi:hypothetical protein